MKRDPERKRAIKKEILSFRHDELSAENLKEILADNPLYSTSVVLRGAILALHRLSKEKRAEMIINAADH